MSLIKIEKLRKAYGNNVILNDLNFSVEKGEMISIMGRSGAGKTTLLNILGLLDSADKGNYLFNDEKIDFNNDKKLSEYRLNKIGFIVQNYALIPSKTAFENISLPLDFKKIPKAEKKSRVLEIAKKLNIEKLLKKHPYEMSGGECQRVAIARALVRNPEVILADEPTGALDEKTEDDIISVIKSLNKTGVSFIIVTHNPKVASVCERQLFIKDGVLLSE
ncbi:ABC transporter ATP-binding protein [Ruminococcus sp.]|uniref:ABC transporter ATP-binding protein n=1 Tax=Ruminococcus sp. TaxID=41978 RepID=UPI0025EB0209|nr:ABC transporter ATP-binding protein [Ruminococcus sp.]